MINSIDCHLGTAFLFACSEGREYADIPGGRASLPRRWNHFTVRRKSRGWPDAGRGL